VIPKIAHFYWGAKKLSYLRYLTIFSFHKYNPDWKIILYIPSTVNENIPWISHEQLVPYIGSDYFSLLNSLPIEKKTITTKESLSEVHKSDILRLYLLSKYGGLWSDMDILYIKPIDLDLSYDVCISRNDVYGYGVGFLLAASNNKFFFSLYEEALNKVEDVDYQAFGANLYNKKFPHISNIEEAFNIRVCNISMDKISPFDANNIDEIFQEVGKLLPEHCIGLHWFGGHPKSGEIQNILTPETVLDMDNYIGLSVRKILEV
jgi:hypothetical protein